MRAGQKRPEWAQKKGRNQTPGAVFHGRDFSDRGRRVGLPVKMPKFNSPQPSFYSYTEASF